MACLLLVLVARVRCLFYCTRGAPASLPAVHVFPVFLCPPGSAVQGRKTHRTRPCVVPLAFWLGGQARAPLLLACFGSLICPLGTASLTSAPIWVFVACFVAPGEEEMISGDCSLCV